MVITGGWFIVDICNYIYTHIYPHYKNCIVYICLWCIYVHVDHHICVYIYIYIEICILTYALIIIFVMITIFIPSCTQVKSWWCVFLDRNELRFERSCVPRCAGTSKSTKMNCCSSCIRTALPIMLRYLVGEFMYPDDYMQYRIYI